ncbi:unnamed protein product [Rhizoctonia solani]|uniref:Uncharacterized protein n=1 Tax=Rhizoctonia solani TaxID=456999 RepID=A0A8H3D9V5_9AGAM|nr:unnamed protein product [Rhizoctonia solani]
MFKPISPATMTIRHFGYPFWLLLAHLISTCSAFSFVFSSQPSQCQSLTIQWTEGTGPYRLFLVPVGHVTPEIRTIVNMEIPVGQLSTNLTLRFPENSRFVAVMSDSTGFGTGGTSSIYTVGSGPSGCLPTTAGQADFYMYTDSATPSQCGSYKISWDAGVTGPVHIYGVIPGGQSFQVNPPSSGTSYDWTTNVREGIRMLFLAVGGNNENGGSTDITTIARGSSGCINSQSPSSTASPAVGGISTIAQPATVTETATNPTASGTEIYGGSASAPAPGTGTGMNTVEGTGGGSADPTATATGGNGSPPSPTGSNNPLLSTTTRGSGGGTVTGDPHLPAATAGLHDSDRRVNLGAVIGGALGGVALLLFLIFIWLLCKQRRNRRSPGDSERLMSERRTDLLDDSLPIMTHDQNYEHDWFRAEPFVPPMSADEFARRTGGSVVGYEDQGDDYDHDQSRSSTDHAIASAGMYGVITRTLSRSTSGHGHRSSHSHSRSFSQSQSNSQNISHSPTHSTSRHASSHGHSRSFSNPYNFSFTPNSGSGRRDTAPLTPPTPMSAVDLIANPTSRPPPSSWHNHASTSANVVPRPRRSGSIHEQPQGKSGIEDEQETHESDMEGDIVDIPPTYESLRRPRITNPDAAD